MTLADRCRTSVQFPQCSICQRRHSLTHFTVMYLGEKCLPDFIPATVINKRYGHCSYPIQPPRRYPVATVGGGVALSTALFTTFYKRGISANCTSHHETSSHNTAAGHRRCRCHCRCQSGATMEQGGLVTQANSSINNAHGRRQAQSIGKQHAHMRTRTRCIQ